MVEDGLGLESQKLHQFLRLKISQFNPALNPVKRMHMQQQLETTPDQPGGLEALRGTQDRKLQHPNPSLPHRPAPIRHPKNVNPANSQRKVAIHGDETCVPAE